MSIFAAPPMANGWQHRIGDVSNLLSGTTNEIGLGLGLGRIQTSTLERPMLRSHRSFPNTLTSTFTKNELAASHPSMESVNRDRSSTAAAQEPKSSAIIQTQPPVHQSVGGSAPVSPLQQHMSPILEDEAQAESNEDEDNFSDYDAGGSDDGDARSGQPERTAEQRRNDKRKMKRFRLTHNQTRFLMGEFARQAHPDAAQRDRLSKEIPGLSPRQVQVWFQNRRAKLKRLTADDREKIMRSRALPDDFDMSQTLHSSFNSGLPQPYVAQYPTSHHSPMVYNPSQFVDHNLNRNPMLISGLRRASEDEHMISPISMSSNFGPFYSASSTTPNPGRVSPISPSLERNTFSNMQYPQTRPRTGPYGSRSASFSSGMPAQIPRLNAGHDRLSTPRSEVAASPLRSSIAYNPVGYDFAPHSAEETGPSSHHNFIIGPRTYPQGTDPSSKPSNFPYLSGQPSLQQSLLNRSKATFPLSLDLRSTYSRSTYPLSPLTQSSSEHSSNQFNAPQSQPLHVTQPQHAAASISPNIRPNSSTIDYQTAQAEQLPHAADLFGLSFQTNPEQEVGNYGISSGLPAAIRDTNSQLESYYKSEHDLASRQSAVRAQTHTPQHEISQPQFPNMAPAMSSQTTQILQQQQSQHFGGRPSTPRSAGLKRRRDEADDEENKRAGAIGQDMGASQRRRSFTLPSGYKPSPSTGPSM